MTQGQKRMTENEWKEIKEYCNHCKDNAFIIAKTGRSRATIGRVRQSENFTDYERIRKGNSTQETKTEQISMEGIDPNTKPNVIADLVSEIATKLCELAAMLNAL